MINISDYDYLLPKHLIAREPRELNGKNRSDSKLLLMDRYENKIYHKKFEDVTDILQKNDILVLNNSQTINAKVVGLCNKNYVDISFFCFKHNNTCSCYIFPDNNISVGSKIKIGNDLNGLVTEKIYNNVWNIEFDTNDLMNEINKIGKPIISHYIKKKLDIKYFQNEYASINGSSELPAAGRHFTKEILQKLENKGVKILYVTLHTGLSSITSNLDGNIENFEMQEEVIDLSEEVAKELNNAIKNKNRIFAVGTTVARTLESCFYNNKVNSYSGMTNLFIYPGYKFNVIDGFFTNFHGPRSSRILLASAFTGKELLKKGYNEAIKNNYMFYEFGDTTLTI